jgi:tetratricopeptide (TPR) repeat protein
MDETTSKYLLICLALAVMTFIAYAPVIHSEFINFDDGDYVFGNNHITSGLTLQNITWAFTKTHADNYHPLTSLSLMLDCELFGVNPHSFHLTNLLFHIANTLLLFLVLSRMTKNLWSGAFVAALFALHPLHVESVAWVSERKDVLSAFFWMLTLFAYIRYVEKPAVGRFLLTLLVFTLGLLSKSMLITLPLILFILDYWPLNRLNSKFSVIKAFFEKLPFIGLSIVFSVITFLVQWQIGLAKSLSSYPLSWRIENAIVSYVVYIEKLFVPTNLAIFYPHPQGGVPLWQIISAVLLLAIVTSLVLWQLRRCPYFAAGWLWFLVTLIPVIGIVQVGLQARADRYTYVPYIGLFIIIAWGVSEISASLPYRKALLSLSAAFVLLAIGLQTRSQAGFWHDSITLYKHTIAVTKNNWWAHRFLADAFIEKGRLAEGIAQLKESLRIDPENATVQHELAKTLLDKGDVNEAIALYQKLLPPLPDNMADLAGINPAMASRRDIQIIIDLYTEANINFATALLRRGDVNEAAKRFNEVLRMNPNSVIANKNLGDIFLQKGQINEALRRYAAVIQIEPKAVLEYKKLAGILLQKDKLQEAADIYLMIVPFLPGYSEVYTNLGIAFTRQGKLDEAYACFIKVTSISPNFADGFVNLASVLALQGKLEQAIEQCDKALKIAPNHSKAIELKQQLLSQRKQPASPGPVRDTNSGT